VITKRAFDIRRKLADSGYSDVLRHPIRMSWITTLSPLPAETAPGDTSGGRFHWAWERDWEH